MQLAFVLTNRAGLPEAGAIADAYAEVTPEGGRPIVWEGGEEGDPDQRALSVGGASLVLAAMPAPVPDGEAEEAVRLSLSALGTGWSLPEHGFHIIIAATNLDEASRVPERCDYTRLVAAVARACQAVGVYWGSASATHEPEFFFETARDMEVPIALWTGVSVARDGDERVSLLSLGMSQFGMEDLLLTGPLTQAGEAIEMFFDLLAYAVRRGSTVVSGETIGRSDDERIEVQIVESPVDPEAKVWRVDLPDES
jgi:hypothetical protein